MLHLMLKFFIFLTFCHFYVMFCLEVVVFLLIAFMFFLVLFRCVWFVDLHFENDNITIWLEQLTMQWDQVSDHFESYCILLQQLRR